MTQLYGALENLKDDVSYLVWSRWKNIFVSVQRAESESEQRLIRETYSMWVREKQTDSETLASSSSWSVLTPKRGIEELERLELWDSFLTPLMWLIGLSFRVGDGISTSFCLSTGWRTNTHIHKRRRTGLLFLFGKGQKCDVDRNQIVVPLTHEGAGDVFRHLVTRATHLWQVGQLSVQHPLKLWQNESKTVRDAPFLQVLDVTPYPSWQSASSSVQHSAWTPQTVDIRAANY